ncbi:MAG: hypothetical protein EOM23_03580 [Candidatus Moranbacteria bacterium]|nr:hypothetical protein [Candidatus Moranbacteria bacterium]
MNNKALMNELYKGSLTDIEDIIFCIEAFKDMNKGFAYTAMDGYFDETIVLCRKELKRLIKYHEEKFDEQVDLKVITDKVKGFAMRIDEADYIINQIKNSGIFLTESEQLFIEGLLNKKTLTNKQANWLKLIYQRT